MRRGRRRYFWSPPVPSLASRSEQGPGESFAGMVGVLALLTAFVVGGLAATGVLSDAATSTGIGGSETEAEIPSGERTTVSIEESVEAGELSWTISEARQTGEIHSYTYP